MPKLDDACSSPLHICLHVATLAGRWGLGAPSLQCVTQYPINTRLIWAGDTLSAPTSPYRQKMLFLCPHSPFLDTGSQVQSVERRVTSHDVTMSRVSSVTNNLPQHWHLIPGTAVIPANSLPSLLNLENVFFDPAPDSVGLRHLWRDVVEPFTAFVAYRCQLLMEWVRAVLALTETAHPAWAGSG